MTTNLKYFLKYIDSKTYNMLKYIIEIILSDLVLTLNIMSTLHIDTRRRFNVDTTSYWCWNDVVCLRGCSSVDIVLTVFFGEVFKMSNNYHEALLRKYAVFYSKKIQHRFCKGSDRICLCLFPNHRTWFNSEWYLHMIHKWYEWYAKWNLAWARKAWL